MLSSKEAYEKTKKSKPKDTRYVLKYIDKRIKDACNQGKFYIILNNQIPRFHFLNKTQYYYIGETPKILETLYIKGYSVDYFQEYNVNKIKISWENKKEKGEI